MLTQEQIDRVLVPHQTTAERNIAVHTEPCIWVRTCYEPSLALAFEEMTHEIRNDAYECYCLFDDPALYGSVGSDLVGLYLRMPQLPDTVAILDIPRMKMYRWSLIHLSWEKSTNCGCTMRCSR
jgi:hypothetical protein